MERTMNISEARNKLTSLSSDLVRDRETLAITKRGKPVLALMPWELYESLLETMEVMSDPEQMASFRAGVKSMEEGKTKGLEQVKAELES
ncbi:MAG: type II toxin-antitoxin system Phd/YefM family antitoxin [Desulfovibrio sp.]|nr:MAG: type II toxin-antitoxin system Phd/YefM family antitoxin [Desulfovibrio sp.]